jgi:HK97 gp10 family phage protein
MANKVTVTFNDFAKKGGDEGLKAAIVQTMVRLRAQAVQLSPDDEGTLKSSIMWRKSWGSDSFGFPSQDGGVPGAQIPKPDGISGVVGTGIEYGVYQEFGTRYMPAQPYLRPAADSIRGATAQDIAKKWGREAMMREFRTRKVTKVTQ